MNRRFLPIALGISSMLVAAPIAAQETPEIITHYIPYSCVDSTVVAPYFTGGDVEITMEVVNKDHWTLKALPKRGSPQRGEAQEQLTFTLHGEVVDPLTADAEDAINTLELAMYKRLRGMTVQRPASLAETENPVTQSFIRAEQAVRAMVRCYVADVRETSLLGRE